MRKMGSYDFGPSLRKPSMKKEQTKLWKRSVKQLKKTRQCFRVSMAKTYNNANRQGDDNVFKRETSHVTVVPRKNNVTCLSRGSNGMKCSTQNMKESMPSYSRIVQRNIDMPRPSSLKPKNGVVSSLRTTKTFSSANNATTCLQNDKEKSRPFSVPKKGMDPSNKNTSDVAPHLRNTENPRTSSSRINNGEASRSKNTEIPRSSSSRPNHDMFSLARNNMSLKARPSRLGNGFSSVLNDDSKSMFGISKESQPSSMFGNSRIAAQFVNGEAQKEDIPAAIEASNCSLKLNDNQVTKNLSSRQIADGSCMVSNKERHAESMDEQIQLNSRKRSISKDGGTDADKHKSTRMEPLSEEKLDTHEDDESEVEISRFKKKRRNLILIDYDEDDDDDGDQSMNGVEIGSAGLTTQTDGVSDCSTEVSNPVLPESLKLQQYGSQPIDEPVWSGIIKTSSKKNVSLAAHLSTKCCEEVWNLAGSLQQEIVVTKLSRMEAWPKSFEASTPTDNNIALYFLPRGMRQDADLDQLVKEVMENDMVLQAVIGEAEMLIFPSILLPEQHRTFQGKPYLWAVFKGRKNKAATAEAQQHGKERCAEDEMGKQQASHSRVGKEGHRVARLNTETGPEAPEEMERQGMEQEKNPSLAGANTPSPATEDPTMNATTAANHGQIHSSLAVPTGVVFGFMLQLNPRSEQLIQELQREGAVVVAMQGEMIGSGLGQAAATGRE